MDRIIHWFRWRRIKRNVKAIREEAHCQLVHGLALEARQRREAQGRAE